MSNNDKSIEDQITDLSDELTDPRIVTQEDKDKWFSTLGSEQAIKNYKQKYNDEINAKIDELSQPPSQQ